MRLYYGCSLLFTLSVLLEHGGASRQKDHSLRCLISQFLDPFATSDSGLDGRIAPIEVDAEEDAEDSLVPDDYVHEARVETIVYTAVSELALAFVISDILFLGLVNFPDKNTREAALATVSLCIAIFSAVLIEHGHVHFLRLIIEDCIVDRPLGVKMLFVLDIPLFILWSCLTSWFAWLFRSDHKYIYASTLVCTHVAAFLVIGMFRFLPAYTTKVVGVEQTTLNSRKDARFHSSIVYIYASCICVVGISYWLVTFISRKVALSWLQAHAGADVGSTPTASYSNGERETGTQDQNAARETTSAECSDNHAERASGADSRPDTQHTDSHATEDTGAQNQHDVGEQPDAASSENHDAHEAGTHSNSDGESQTDDESEELVQPEWIWKVHEEQVEASSLVVSFLIRNFFTTYIIRYGPKKNRMVGVKIIVAIMIITTVVLSYFRIFIRRQLSNSLGDTISKVCKYIESTLIMSLGWMIISLTKVYMDTVLQVYPGLQYIYTAAILSPICLALMILTGIISLYIIPTLVHHKSISKTLSLVVGFSCEKGLKETVQHVARHVHGWQDDGVRMEYIETIICLSLGMLMLVVWVAWILPNWMPQIDASEEAFHRLSDGCLMRVTDKFSGEFSEKSIRQSSDAKQ